MGLRNCPKLQRCKFRGTQGRLQLGRYGGNRPQSLPSGQSSGKPEACTGKFRATKPWFTGLVAGAKQANRELLYAGYPITPASPILEGLSALKKYGVKTLQAEDEIAAM